MRTAIAPGWRVWAAGVAVIGLAALAFGDFSNGQPVPKDFPARHLLVLLASGLLVAAAAGVQWRRTAGWASGVLAVYYGLVVVVLMDGRVILRNLTVVGAYTGAAEPAALAATAVIVWASTAGLEPARARRIVAAARLVFGVCAILFGIAHFAYMELTAPLVPKWLPLSGTFWGYATGVAQIAGGLAILTGVRARLASLLLAVMYAAFAPLVHLPRLLADPADHFVWSETAMTIALAGAAWAVAESLEDR